MKCSSIPHGWRIVTADTHIATAVTHGPNFVTFDLSNGSVYDIWVKAERVSHLCT